MRAGRTRRAGGAGKAEEAAFTLLEIIMVIAIVAFIYTVALPNIAITTNSEVASRLGRLNEDIRGAYDISVLSGKPHRLVFKLITGDYWLEVSDRRDITLGDRLVAADLDSRQEKERAVDFDEAFKKYEDLAGETFRDAESDDLIPPSSPLLQAKERLRGPSWHKLDGPEWQTRSLGNSLMLRDLQAEHHERPITVEDQGQDAVGMIYFLPMGYAERSVLHIYYNKGTYEIDPDQQPYTIIIDPYQGVGDIRSGFEEINVHEEQPS